MATHSGPGSDRFTGEQARDAMGLLDSDGAQLADRLVKPWWYHVIHGGLVALLAVLMIRPGSTETYVALVGVVAIMALPAVFRRRHGIAVSFAVATGPRSRRLRVVVIGVILLTLLSGLVLELAGIGTRWVLLPAVLGGTLVAVLGRRYDKTVRQELCGGGPARGEGRR